MTYYELLGVSPTASPDEIHGAYRRAIRRYHPDVNKAPNAGLVTMRLNDAWATLADRRSRTAYDHSLGIGAPPFEVDGWQPHQGSYVPYRTSSAHRYATMVYGGLTFAALFAFVASAVHWLPLVATICGTVLVARLFARAFR